MVASVGVATVSYVVACEHPSAGNLAPPQPAVIDAGPAPMPSPVAGNLMAVPIPPPSAEADAGPAVTPVTGSLAPPPSASASASAKPQPGKPPSRHPVSGNLAPPRGGP